MPGPAPSRLPRARRADVLLAAALALLTAGAYLAGLLERLELIAIDARYQLFPAPVRPDILLVLIDAESLRRVGQWPWPRSVHARLLRRLGAAGVRAVGYDVEFGKPRGAAEDAELAAAVAEVGNVVLAVFHEVERTPGGLQISRATPLMPELRRAGAAAGAIGFPTDVGGGVRRARLADEVGGDPHWTFALEVVRRAEGLPPGGVRWGPGGRLLLGARALPVGPHGVVYVDYAGGRGTFPAVPAADILEGRVGDRELRGKVVLLGASAVELQDLHYSPYPGVLPGVEIQANLVNALLRGVVARRLPPWMALALVVGLAAAAPPAAARLTRWSTRPATRALRLAGAALVALAVLSAAAALLFWRWRLFLDVVPPALFATGAGVGLVMAEGVRSGRRASLAAVALAAAAPGRTAPGSPLEQAGEVLFQGLREGMRVDVLVLELRGSQGDPVRARCVLPGGPAAPGPESTACRAWADRALGEGQAFLVPALGAAFGPSNPGAPPFVPAGSAFLPLLVEGKATGVLHVHRTAAPFDPEDLGILGALAAQVALSARNAELLRQVRDLYVSSLAALADAIEARDAYTAGHCERVSNFSVRLAERLGLPAAEVEEIRVGALIHDIGKIGVPDGILGKPGGLTDVEWRTVQSHTLIGGRIVGQLPVSRTVRDVVLYHHERYDGTGYPHGLRGEAIPLPARIVAVADVYEVLTGGRAYRGAVTRRDAAAELRRVAGTQFDPHLVDQFLQALEAEEARQPHHPA